MPNLFKTHQSIFRHLGGSLVFALGMSLLPQANAEPLALDFVPPDINPVQVCTPRASDEATIEFWEQWDGKSFGTLSSALVKRDIKRLQHIDAAYWLNTILHIIAKLEERDSSYSGKNSLLTRIQAMEAAGEFQKIRNLQLVQQLAVDADHSSPRVKNALAKFYRDGVGVERDADRADALLVMSGYEGNADALLELVKRDQNGDPVAGWDVPNELSVTMAFGSLVGELNPTICDRTARIAREYHNGEVVTKKPELARAWFQFTADLGDANAAWKLVEYHIQSEGFEKDNDVLLKYLQQSADAELPFAQIELGRLYERGSLIERDLDKTLALFRAAAGSNERPGLTRLGLFLEEYEDRYPDLQNEKIETFHKLAALPDAPGWVFTRLAQHTQETKGRWGGLDESIQFLENAAALGDIDGTGRLAMGLLAQNPTDENFERAVTLLGRVVSVHGGVTPSKQLYSAFMCKAQNSPRVQEAQYWGGIEAATDTANVDLSAYEIAVLAEDRSPRTLAVLQSQALYGRPSSLASWLKFLELDPSADEDLKTFWSDYSEDYSFVLEALAKLELELAVSREARLAAFDLLRREFNKSGAPAAVTLARALLEDNDGAWNNEIEDILGVSSRQGIGDAIQLIATLRAPEVSAEQVYAKYADIIATNGDFDALVFALPFLSDVERDVYFNRAISLIQCDYKNAMSLARAAFDIGLQERGEQWIEIASNLTDGYAWAFADLAKAKLDHIGISAAEEAAELFRVAASKGDTSAKHRLFELMINPNAATFAPPSAVEMITASVQQADYDALSTYLGRYRRSAPHVQEYIETNLDLPDIHRIAAESGDVFAMRYYGMHLRENALTADALTQSTQWLQQAAEGGDVTAMAEYGQALAFGIGVDADLDSAKSWLADAAAKGNKQAAEIMSLVTLSSEADS